MLIVLSVVTCDCCKQMNNRLDWAFRNSALEVGLPAFQLHMFAKCDAVPNEICSTCFVSGIHYLYLFLQRHSTHEDIRKSVRVDFWVANPARTSPGSVFELWISDGFELFFAVHFLYPKFVLARSKQLMPVTVKFQIDVLVCGLQGHLFPSFDVGPMFPWNRNKSHEAIKICRDSAFSYF